MAIHATQPQAVPAAVEAAIPEVRVPAALLPAQTIDVAVTVDNEGKLVSSDLMSWEDAIRSFNSASNIIQNAPAIEPIQKSKVDWNLVLKVALVALFVVAAIGVSVASFGVGAGVIGAVGALAFAAPLSAAAIFGIGGGSAALAMCGLLGIVKMIYKAKNKVQPPVAQVDPNAAIRDDHVPGQVKGFGGGAGFPYRIRVLGQDFVPSKAENFNDEVVQNYRHLKELCGIEGVVSSDRRELFPYLVFLACNQVSCAFTDAEIRASMEENIAIGPMNDITFSVTAVSKEEIVFTVCGEQKFQSVAQLGSNQFLAQVFDAEVRYTLRRQEGRAPVITMARTLTERA